VCFFAYTRRVNLVTYPVISHERGKDREVLTTSETYPWSFGTQIFRNGQPSHGGDRKIVEVMTSHCICRVQPIIRLLINMLFIVCLFVWMVCVSVYLLDLFFSV
jgi:hypothetical protein